MSKKDYSWAGDPNWFEMQKQFMDALTAFNKPDNPNPFDFYSTPKMDSPWLNAMEYWWQAIKPGTPAGNENLFEKIIGQCRSFYLLSEQFSKLVDGMAKMKSNSEDIVSFINEEFKKMEAIIEANQNIFNWGNMIDACEQPVELMKNTMSFYPVFFGDRMNDLHPEVRKVRDQYLSIPGLGYGREIQEKIQDTIRLWANYQDNSQEYQIALSKLNHKALESMRKKILRMTKKGEEVNSMREVYGIWVESNEKVYADYVLTEEYAELNGRLVNSLMAFKKQSHELNEEILSALNMPTTKALNTLERRQYELRKQVRELEDKLKKLQKETQTKTGQVSNKPEKKAVKKRKKPARAKKRIRKLVEEDQTKIVAFKPSKKASSKNMKTTKKKTRKKATSPSSDKGMIKIKL